MRRILVGAAIAVLVSGNAHAAAYDDFARGLAANNRGDSDTAIEAFTKAIDAGDLAAGLKPAAYHGRAAAYQLKHHCREALSDAEAALALKPDYYDAKSISGETNACLKNYDKAQAIFTELIAVRPRPGIYADRGWARWRLGAFADAAADFSDAAELAPRDGYMVVWLALMQAKAGAVDKRKIEDAISRTGSSDWPIPVVGLLAGGDKPDDIAAAAQRGGADGLKGRQCEADFYTGEWHLMHKDAAAARASFDKAIGFCPQDYVEYRYAKIEREEMK